MGLFGNIFGNSEKEGKKAEKSIPWIPLTSLGQIDDIDKKSQQKTQIIFKHSTTCGISRMVMNMFNGNYSFSESQLDLYYLDLHAYREISNEVGIKYQVLHQSPQLIVVKNGTAIAHASHGAIAELELSNYL